MPSLKEKLEALKKKQTAPATPAPEPTPDTAQCGCGSAIEGECSECDGDQDILDRLQSLGKTQGVNPPPDSPTPTTDPGTTPCPYCGKEFKHLSRHKCKEQPVETTPEQPAPPAPAQEEPTPTPPAEPPTKDTDRPAEPEDAPGFFIALVDVLPVRDFAGSVTQVFEDIIAPLADSVAKTNQVPHWKMVDYGKGGGQLARLLDDYLQAKPITGFLLCSGGTAEFQACRSVINSRARNVLLAVK